MKIRCNNCYRVLNKNEEYCTKCGEHSERMQQAMISGNYGPNPNENAKLGFGLFALAGFLICGILQVVFATIEYKEKDLYTSLFCQSNSLFYSSIIVAILAFIFFYKEIKKIRIKSTMNQWLGGCLVGVLGASVCILLADLFSFTQILPSYIVEYLTSDNAIFFDLKNECIFKILIGSMLSVVVLEFILKKYLIDALDDTTLDDKAIFALVVLATSACEVLWTMSLDIVIITIVMNCITTGIYMYTNRNVLLNMIIRMILVVATILIYIL